MIRLCAAELTPPALYEQVASDLYDMQVTSIKSP